MKGEKGKPEACLWKICPFIITFRLLLYPGSVILCDGTEPTLLPNHSNKCFSITAVRR